MYSQMVEEIVPFAEKLATVLVITSKDTSNSACSRVREFNLREAFGVRYMDLLFEGR